MLPGFLPLLAGGLGAVIATLLAHYVNVVVGDAVATMIGFALGYLIGYRITPRRAGTLSIAAGGLLLFFADRALYEVGMHGLPRKLGAVVLAVAAFAGAAQLSSPR